MALAAAVSIWLTDRDLYTMLRSRLGLVWLSVAYYTPVHPGHIQT